MGAVLGARVLMKVSGERLRLPFMFILMVVACQMLPQGFGINPLDQMQQCYRSSEGQQRWIVCSRFFSSTARGQPARSSAQA